MSALLNMHCALEGEENDLAPRPPCGNSMYRVPPIKFCFALRPTGKPGGNLNCLRASGLAQLSFLKCFFPALILTICP